MVHLVCASLHGCADVHVNLPVCALRYLSLITTLHVQAMVAACMATQD